eukprot:SAG31_NODE_6948_length_1840_cov_1.426766_4_plen_32_part_01
MQAAGRAAGAARVQGGQRRPVPGRGKLVRRHQ